MTSEVRHDEDRSRYTLWVDGEAVGLADYARRGADVVFLHTEIAPARRHEGLGDTLVGAALDDAHERFGAHIVPACPFVAEFIAEHPDYQELLAS
ncbi:MULTISPECIES: GNAT family N-acetyltransferase [unclassified Rathayibacter]|uniref:GNAT family N-acetyltransferase n=1 Tax=unclassified Rathayibacter TaxID=2609250 RepID=UPI00188A2E76|nr:MULTISPECIES: GNAT family N-acetyltransferase [unclassified Rathayibacter]MBF4461518.1 N-acetyltransferase [Rathayibacter sp. VKM Ac-2879]MBF4502929.1 N-acetyltransferase [Rathayibacter sp. VKM Ac-2878]